MVTYFVYWIVSGKSSYIGATVNPKRRLKQHCGVITGGAARTRGKLWKFQCVISGFQTWKQALQFEWAAKYYSKRCRSIETRKLAIESVMNRERWTSNAPLSSEVPLSIEYNPIQYGLPPDTITMNEWPRPRNKKTTKKVKRIGGVVY
jgi:predicted GIY-YIG superfamily endonuclease